MKGLVQQVEEKGYSPPRREKILEYHSQQDFPICPDPDDTTPATHTRNCSSPTGVSTRVFESTGGAG